MSHEHPEPSDQSTAAPVSIATRVRRVARGLLAAGVAAGLALGALLVAFLLGEALVRVVAPQQLISVRPDIWMPEDSVGWSNRSLVQTTINTGERTATVLTDAEGFRIGPTPRDTTGRQVLLVGDSFAQALQVDYDDSFAALLERSVARQLGAPVAMRNAAVDGWDPPQYLWRVRRALATRRYDALLVTIYLGNDVVASTNEYRRRREPMRDMHVRWPRRFDRSGITEAVLYPLNDQLKRHSHLFVLLKQSLDVLLMRLGFTATDFPDEILRSEASSARWDITANFCERIADVARRHGVPTLFAMIASSYQVDSMEFRQFARGFNLNPERVDLEQPNRLLGERLAARHLNVVDPLERFRTLARQGQQLYGRRDRHFSPAGHVAFAAAVEGALVPLMRIGSRAAPRAGGNRAAGTAVFR